jgi:hypothetical protein
VPAELEEKQKSKAQQAVELFAISAGEISSFMKAPFCSF